MSRADSFIREKFRPQQEVKVIDRFEIDRISVLGASLSSGCEIFGLICNGNWVSCFRSFAAAALIPKSEAWAGLHPSRSGAASVQRIRRHRKSSKCRRSQQVTN